MTTVFARSRARISCVFWSPTLFDLRRKGGRANERDREPRTELNSHVTLQVLNEESEGQAKLAEQAKEREGREAVESMCQRRPSRIGITRVIVAKVLFLS